jgi:hypothetical protein
MKLYLTKQQALDDYPVTEVELDLLIDQGKLNAIMLKNRDEQILAIYDDDLASYIAERDISPEMFDDLKDKQIGITEAGLKYQVSPMVISGWIKQGRLNIVGNGPRNKKFINEAEVAYLAKIGQAKKMRPGKKPFN